MHKKINFSVLIILFISSCTSEVPTATRIGESITQDRSDQTHTPTTALTPKITSTPQLTTKSTPTRVPMNDFMKGVMFAAFFEGEYSSPSYDWALENVVKPMGANWITIAFSCLKDPAPSTEITCGIDNKPTKEEVKHVVNLAHELGLRVLMEVMAPSRETSSSYDGQPIDKWFDGYRAFITDYAAYAEEIEVDMFSIGCEIAGTQLHDKEWREVAESVREIYSGPITYSADKNWSDITWWDSVDYIGLHPFSVPLSTHNDPTVEEMVANLKPFVNQLEALSMKFGREVIITTVMYRSIDGVSMGDAVYFDPNQTFELDLQEHADVHEAWIRAFQDKPWFKGIFLGSYSANSLYNPPSNIFLSMYDKPADDILRSFYGAEPKPTSTPIVYPAEQSNNIHTIYTDSFLSNWKPWLPDSKSSQIETNHKDIVKGGDSISVVLGRWATLEILAPSNQWGPHIDIADYNWIIFDLYVTEDKVHDEFLGGYHPVNLLMKLGSGNLTPFSVLFTSAPYIEEGFLPKHWQKVRIPFDAFGPILNSGEQVVGYISIMNLSGNTIHFYIDNISLIME